MKRDLADLLNKRRGYTPGEPVYKAATLIPHETKSARVDVDAPIRFVASNEAEDRYGDIVRADGWDLKSYKTNPIVLFSHSHYSPIGTSTRTWLEDKNLMDEVVMAEAGTSAQVDYIRALVAQKVLRAVSVGFLPSEAKEMLKDGYFTGYEFIKQELLEISIVAVPAHREALQVARDLGISDDVTRSVLRPAIRGLSHQRARTELERLRVSGK